jgi:hypothetical protein
MEELQKRGPGRPPKYQEVSANVAEIDAPRNVRQRKPFGSLEQKLAYPSREGYHRHWFNDVRDRITRAQEAGYEHVKDGDGKNVARVVGTHPDNPGPLTAYLMEIPEEWWAEDMRAQQKVVDEKEDAMRRGELDSKPGDNRYVPSQGISIKHG